MSSEDRLDYLDGLRGLAAAWVLVGHALILTGWRVPLLATPDLAVDLFMMISGFLMFHHWRRRASVEPSARPRTWMLFWIRRFFRIAPVFYLALAAALLLGPLLGGSRDTIAAALPATATDPARYLDQGWSNILSHLSFIFGALPHYHFRTALPDWSIGLEMQFYAVFPFIALMTGRLGAIRASAVLVAACGLLWLVAGGFMAAFEMPSFLPLKLNVFLAGLLIAEAMTARRPLATAGAALLLAVVPLHHDLDPKHMAVRLACALLLAAFALRRRFALPAALRAVLDAASHLLGRGLFRFMGEVSYGVYLVHLVVMVPVAGLVMAGMGMNVAPAWRAMACIALVAPLAYSVSWLLLVGIERPGIDLGRWLVARTRDAGGAWSARRLAQSPSPER